VTLATADRVDFVFLSPNGAPGGWAGRTDPGPNAWSATAGTYFWQVVATWTDAAGVFHQAVTGVARLFLGIPAPAAPTGPGAGGGGGRPRNDAADVGGRRHVLRPHRDPPAHEAHARPACGLGLLGAARDAHVSLPAHVARQPQRLPGHASFTHVRSGERIVARTTVTGRRASRQCLRTRSFASCSTRFRWRATLAARTDAANAYPAAGRPAAAAAAHGAHVHREAHREQREHGCSAARPGASSRALTRPIWIVTRMNSPAAIPMSRPVRGPAIASSSRSAVRAVEDVAEGLVRVEARRPKMPRPAKKICRTTRPAQTRASQP
jgi:hypothetical protein